MPTYIYKAVTKKGLIVRNRVEEGSKLVLMRKLKAAGLAPISINQTIARKIQPTTRRKRNINNIQEVMKNTGTTQLDAKSRRRMSNMDLIKSYFAMQQKITERDLVIFTQNFYLLKKANFNNVHALSTIIDSTENMAFAGILEDILAGVEAGDYMYKTMEYYSNVFPFIYINMIRVGELSGSLENSLQQAVEYLDNSTAITKKIRGILIPNIAQFVLLIAMLFIGTLYALPQVQGVLDSLGASKDVIPAATLAFQAFLRGFLKWWPIPVTILGAIVVAIIIYIQTPKGKYKFHYFKYTMPIFGKLIFSLDFSRLMKAMLLNLRNGMRIQDSLDVSKNVVNNYVMLSIIENSLNNILLGESWIDPFEKSGLASSMIIEMLKIGMQTDLPEMMDKLVEYMEIDINNTIEKITMVLPQVMYSIVGVVLIFFVVIVLVPMIQIYFGNFLFDMYL